MAGSDFDWMVSNHAVWGVEGSGDKHLCQAFLSFSSLSFSLPSFPKKRLILRLEAVNLISRITTEKHTKKTSEFLVK